MDDLPELPFEKVLSYLNLEDLFKSRAVCRAWRNMIDRFRVKCLCYTQDPIDYYFPKRQMVGRAFAASLVRSSSFEGFFGTYGQSILSSLKRLRLCALHLPISSLKVFASTLQSFEQLEHLSIIETSLGCELKKVQSVQLFRPYPGSDSQREFDLNMPMLESLHFEEFYGLCTLTLDAPKLRSLTFRECDIKLELELVHADSVEWLSTTFKHVKIMELKNLKYFFERSPTILSTKLIPSLGRLKEVHLSECRSLSELFKQRQRYGYADLKIYANGCLVNGPDDPARNVISYKEAPIDYLVANPTRMADHIPFSNHIWYEDIAQVSSEFAISLLKRCPNLTKMIIFDPVEDIERFLHLLKNSEIAELSLSGNQPQELLDRLPEYYAIQKLDIDYLPSNLAFLFSLKHLVSLKIDRG